MAVKNVGTHISHCCEKHGCKYRESECPVVLKQEEQTQACPYCTSTATLKKRIAELQEQLAWSAKLEAKGMIVFGEDEDYY